MWKGIITGVGAGVVYSLSQYAKKKGQPFNLTKFATTVGVGLVTGVATQLLGMEMETTYLLMINMGMVPIVENVIKTAYRRLW